MPIICPPKGDSKWKELVKQVGEERAYVSFFRNGHEIPDVERARAHLAKKPEGYVAPQIGAVVAPTVAAPVAEVQTGAVGPRGKVAVGVGPDGNPDLLTDIAEHVGKLQTIGGGGENDDIKSVLDQGAARLLRGGKGGMPGDQAMEILNNAGYKFKSPAELADAISQAVRNRQKYGAAFKAQAYQRQIEDAALENAGRHVERTPTEGIPIAEIGVGGEFNIRGEKFTVTDVTEDGEHFVVQDGHKFNVPVDALVYPDKDVAVKPGAKPSTDFLPPEEQAAQQAAAAAKRAALDPKPTDVAPLGDSTTEPPAQPGTPQAIVEKAAADLQAQPKGFDHGRVIESEPTVDLRSLENVTPEGWEKILAANMESGTRGSTKGNRAETRIAVALEAPDGQVVVAGLVKPQKVLNESGFYDLNAPSLQKMGVKKAGKRVVQDGGDSPALVKEVVKSGWKPLAILHFVEEPGKIFERFATRTAFDEAWNASTKVAGEKRALPHAAPEVITARRGQAEVEAEIDQAGARLQTEMTADERAALENRVLQLYDELDRVTRGGQSQTGDTNIGDVALRQAEEARDRLPITANRTNEFQRMVSNLRSMGGKVDLFAREFFAQGSRDIIQQQIKQLQGALAQAKTDGERASIQRRLDDRAQRLADVSQAQGVTFSPWHIAVSMDDVSHATLNNFVTLIHEASESLAQRLNPVMRGRVQRAVESALGELRERARAAAEKNSVTVARETGAIDLLSETLGQKLTAEGVPDAPSLAQAIVRWIKDLYYRTAMAAQRAFGAEPDGNLSLAWFENQLRRELFGDYDYRMAKLLDRFLPEPIPEAVRRFTRLNGTPGRIADYFNPLTQRFEQPGVLGNSVDAINWTVEFQTGAPGKELAIPDPEARLRIKTAALNEVTDFMQRFHKEAEADAPFEKWWKLFSRDEDPRTVIGAAEAKIPGSATAKIGGERMTEVMNGEAKLEARRLAENIQFSAVSELSKAREGIDLESDKSIAAAKQVNQIEGDRRNAAMHEDNLRAKGKELVQQLVKDYSQGLDTANQHGELAEAVRQAEGLLEDDPIPEHYQQVFRSIADGNVSLFDYVRAIARLDLPLSDLSPAEIVKAIRDNAEGNETLAQLARNKPLTVALAALARKNADMVDEIQLGWLRDAEQYRVIHDELQVIRRANTEQLRQLLANMNAQRKAVGLSERIKQKYLQRRLALRTANSRIERYSDIARQIEGVLPKINAEVERLQQDTGGVPSEWRAANGSVLTAMTQDELGRWRRRELTLQFNPDGTAINPGAIETAIAQNKDWLKTNAAKRGTILFEQVEKQTTELAMLDLRRKYHDSWIYGVTSWMNPLSMAAKKLEHAFQTPLARAMGLGGAGGRLAQQLLRFQELVYGNHEQAQVNARQWTAAFNAAVKASGLKDEGLFRQNVYDAANYFLGVNPGLDEGPALRQALRIAKGRLPKAVGEDFDAAMTRLLRATKQSSEHLLALAEKSGSFIKDDRLKSEFRRAIARGWLTNMRSMDANAVMRITSDMQKAGWRLEFKEVEGPNGTKRKSVVKATTFDGLDRDSVSEANSENLRTVLNRYFTPGILNDWLIPFIRKGGAEVFKWNDEAIPQADLQTAWLRADNNVLAWIDELGKMQGHSPDVGDFRLSILKQIDGLFTMESRAAYDASQVKDFGDPMGPKPHVMMDARENDLLPSEHLNFATYDTTATNTLLGQIAFHAAFGRNGELLTRTLRELTEPLKARQEDYLRIKARTRNARVAEAVARGLGDYDKLERDANRYKDADELRNQLEAIFGINRAGALPNWNLLSFVTGQIVDNPKTGLYHILQIMERPFATRSLGPMAVTTGARAYGTILKTALGSFLEDLNLHLFHASDTEKQIGFIRGASRNLPWDATIAELPPKGDYSNHFKVTPLGMARFMRNVQQKGVSLHLPTSAEREFPRTSVIPGLGVFNTMGQMAAIGGHSSHITELRKVISKAIDYFSTHKDAASDPSFRLKAADLRMGNLDRGLFDWWRDKLVEYNMGKLEDLARDAMGRRAQGEDFLTKDQVLRASMMAANEIDGFASINTSPLAVQTNPWFRRIFPLLRWPLWKMHQVHEGLNTAEGQRTFASVLKGVGTLALWNLPVGIAFTFLWDNYDEKLLHKKNLMRSVSPLAAIPLVGPLAAIAGADHPGAQVAGLIERGARAGNIYGLGAELALQLVSPLDPQSGQRQFSMDQRILAMSQLMNFSQAMANLANTDTATWAGFWRPFITSMGGNGVLHTVDLMNNALGLDNAEARTVMRINSTNYLRSAGKELGIEMRGSTGAAFTPTPLSAHTREMFLAAMAGDNVDFHSAYLRALDAARATVADDPRIPIQNREREAENRVRESWRARDPLDVFRQRPTPAQVSQMLAIMDDQGKQDVQQALQRYRTFDGLITPSAADRQFTRQFNRMTQPPRLRIPSPGSLLFSP
jgi:hypothetical protein